MILLYNKIDNIIKNIKNQSEITFDIHKKNSINKNYELLSKNSLKILLLSTSITTISFISIYTINKLSNEIEQIELELQRSKIINSNLIEKTQNLKDENYNLKNEKYELENNFNILIKKTNELENKINEINGMKEKLYDSLDEMSTIGNKYKKILNSEESKIKKTKEFSSLIYNPYETVLSTETIIDSIENKVNTSSVEFFTATDNIKTTLASKQKIKNENSIPSLWPTKGNITSYYENRKNPLGNEYEFHKGIDIAVPKGTPIYATASGKIIKSEYSKSYGYYIVIDHQNEYKTLYAHNSSLNVKKGDYVNAGEQIAYSGATGNVTGAHLHYEVIENNKRVNPKNFLD